MPLLNICVAKRSIDGTDNGRNFEYRLRKNALDRAGSKIRKEQYLKERWVEARKQINVQRLNIVENSICRSDYETVAGERCPSKANARREVVQVRRVDTARNAIRPSHDEQTVRDGGTIRRRGIQIRTAQTILNLHRWAVVLPAKPSIDDHSRSDVNVILQIKPN